MVELNFMECFDLGFMDVRVLVKPLAFDMPSFYIFAKTGKTCLGFQSTNSRFAQQKIIYPLDAILRRLSNDPLPTVRRFPSAIMAQTCPFEIGFATPNQPNAELLIHDVDWKLGSTVNELDTFFTRRLNDAKHVAARFLRDNGANYRTLSFMKRQAYRGENWRSVAFSLVFAHLRHEKRTLFDVMKELFPLDYRIIKLEKLVRRLHRKKRCCCN